jgi:hypothetical protein
MVGSGVHARDHFTEPRDFTQPRQMGAIAVERRTRSTLSEDRITAGRLIYERVPARDRYPSGYGTEQRAPVHHRAPDRVA